MKHILNINGRQTRDTQLYHMSTPLRTLEFVPCTDKPLELFEKYAKGDFSIDDKQRIVH
jgi:hypothetical protein